MQNSLQHSHAITILGAILVDLLDPYVAYCLPYHSLDRNLILTALAIHDVGEGEIKKDTLYIDKTPDGDLEEYFAFRERYARLGPRSFEPLHRAFLLQFTFKDPEVFPPDACHEIQRLGQTHLYEALAFDAIERWDYVLYALEQYHERGNEKILVQTLRNQIPHFERLTEKLPGFSQTIWTQEISLWTNDFLSAHEGEWIEQKGEV